MVSLFCFYKAFKPSFNRPQLHQMQGLGNMPSPFFGICTEALFKGEEGIQAIGEQMRVDGKR